MTTNVVTRWEVVDANAVPREYLTVDEKKVGAVVRAGVSNIPGVRIWQEPDLSVRAR